MGFDRAGNVYLTGYTGATVGPYRIAMQKYAPNGILSWSQLYAFPPAQTANPAGLVVDSNGYSYVTGITSNNGIVQVTTLKYDPNGDTLWTRTFCSGEGNDQPMNIGLDHQGNVIVVGASWDTLVKGFSTMIIKYDAGGNLLWHRELRRYASWDYFQCVGADSLGNIVAAGLRAVGNEWSQWYIVKFSPSGDTLWGRAFGGSWSNSDHVTSLVVQPSGHSYLVGDMANQNEGEDITAMSLNADGAEAWQRSFGGPAHQNDYAYDVKVDSQGNIYSSGYVWYPGGITKMVALKYRPDGTQVWQVEYLGNWAYTADGYIAVDKAGGLYLAGQGYGPDTIQQADAVLVKFDSTGTFQWVQTYDDPYHGNDYFTGVAADDSGNVYARGYTFMGLANYYDFLLVKYTQQALAHDVGCTRIMAPTGVLDSGANVTPACSVANWGKAAETFNVRLKIGGAYNNAVAVSGLAPGARGYVAFPTWSASVNGAYAVSCSTELAGDLNSGNDRSQDSIVVRVNRDVGVRALVAPAGTLDSGSVVTPACTLYNYGTTTPTYPVLMRIGSVYSRTVSVGAHAPGAPRYVTFPPCTLRLARGSYAVTCTTELAGDIGPANNVQNGGLTIQVQDVGCYKILLPAGKLDSGQVITPACTLANYGSVTESYAVSMKFGATYNRTLSITNQASGRKLYVTFPSCTLRLVGTNVVICSTQLASDDNRQNDKKRDSITVRRKSGGADNGLADSTAARPVGYSLQARPNPCRQFTAISFSLPEAGFVRLDLFDVTGKLVAELVRAECAAGRRSYNLACRSLQSGVYMIRFAAGDRCLTQRFTVE
jgi:uncharacterized protein (DUF2147 family)